MEWMKKIVALANPDSLEYERREFLKRNDVEFLSFELHGQREIMKATKDAEVFLYSGAQITSEIIDNMEKCRLICRYGIGYDDIDYMRAAERGIMVCNAPNYGVIDVAEHAVALLLACSKRLIYMNDCVRDKFWNISEMGASSRMSDKTIGFIGFGKIARCVCTRTNVLGMKAIVYDPYVKNECLNEYGAEGASLDKVLQTADYVTLHMPLNSETRHILGMNEFQKMKRTAYLVNTSRGGLINEPELVDALENGVIAGAGLDVFEEESANLDSRLLSMKNVVLTPHVAWNTAEASGALHKEVTDNVIRYLNGEKPLNIVNM